VALPVRCPPSRVNPSWGMRLIAVFQWLNALS